MKYFKRYLLLVHLITAYYFVSAQEKPFWNEIKNFKYQDSLDARPKNAILFVGSSSLRMWENIQSCFPGKTIINRGFGGSSLPDVILYAEDIIFPYQPKQIVIYCGENDIASGASAQETLDRVKELIQLIRRNLSHTNIVFISIKPSPSRSKFIPEVKKANELIKNYIKRDANAAFADVFNPMLDKTGNPMPHLFLEDSLHMNASGYAIWKKSLDPFLLK